jgi:hypothetical protein
VKWRLLAAMRCWAKHSASPPAKARAIANDCQLRRNNRIRQSRSISRGRAQREHVAALAGQKSGRIMSVQIGAVN